MKERERERERENSQTSCATGALPTPVYARPTTDVVSQTYAMLLRKGACAFLEQAREGNFDEGSKSVAHLLSRAAGVLNYANEVELSKWTNKPAKDMPEKLSETYLVLST